MNEIREQTEGEKKLSQLLGEYMEEKKKNPEGFLEISTVLMCSGDSKATDSYMVSKQFGFIEWLVKNNKINFEKADADISKDIVLGREPDFADFMVYRRFLDEEKVLMLLSIQDEPVKFLSEILKDE